MRMPKFGLLTILALIQIILGVLVILPWLNLLSIRGTDVILAILAIITGVLILRGS